jgi:hypothetical protein
MTAEEEVRERVMSYIRDRHDFEVYAWRSVAEPMDHEQWLVFEARSQAFARPHLTDWAMSRHTAEFGEPPVVDPSTSTIVEVRLSDSWAVVVVADDRGLEPEPTHDRYRLRRQPDGRWLVSSRSRYREYDTEWVKSDL